MKRKLSARSGFTLIELSFAIAFISVLLITIALITSEIVTLYRRGYAIKTVNAVGRDLIDDFTGAVTDSPPASISSFCGNYDSTTAGSSLANCNADGGNYSVFQQYYAKIRISVDGDESDKTVPVNGVFCTGRYSYIWNTGYLFNNTFYKHEDGSNLSDLRLALRLKKESDSSTRTLTDFRLIKIKDTSRSVCTSVFDADNYRRYPRSNEVLQTPEISGVKVIEISYDLSDEPVELLSKSDNDLALYDFVVFDPAQVASTGRLFYSASFILGTINGGVDIMTSSNFCKAPSTFSADFSYCAINKFNFSIQASGS